MKCDENTQCKWDVNYSVGAIIHSNWTTITQVIGTVRGVHAPTVCDISRRNAGYGSPEVGEPLPPDTHYDPRHRPTEDAAQEQDAAT